MDDRLQPGECEEEGNRDRVGLVSVKFDSGLLLPVVTYALYFIDRSSSNPSFLQVFVNECYLEDKFRKFRVLSLSHLLLYWTYNNLNLK